MRLTVHLSAVACVLLLWIPITASEPSPPTASLERLSQAEIVILDEEEAVVVERVGKAIVLRTKGPKVPGTGGGNNPRERWKSSHYEWFLVQDSTLGVVFQKPSGVKNHWRDGKYDGDIHLQILREIEAIEVRVLLFNVWRDFRGTRTTTEIQLLSPGKPAR